MMTRAFLILWILFGATSPMWDKAQSQVSGDGSDAVMSGTIDLTTVGANYMVPVVNGQGVLGADITGVTGSGATIVTEGTVNGTFWTPLNMLPAGSGGVLAASLNTDTSFRTNTSGKTWVRVRVFIAGTGTAAITSSLSTNSSITAMTASLPPGSNQIGGVLVNNFPATQAISGSVGVSNFPATQPVSGVFWQAVQPVSTPTCANAPTTQVAVSTTAVQIVAARSGRYKVTVSPTTNVAYFVSTNPSVTTGNGLAVLPGGSYTFTSGLALYAVAPTSMTLSSVECY